MNYDIRKPSKVLAPYVKCYWALDAVYRGASEPYRVTPQGCVEVMFFHKTPYTSITMGTQLPRTIITGQQSSYFDLCALGDIGIFSVIFKPHGAKMFFKTPLNEVTNRSVSLVDFAGRDAAGLEERVMLAKSNAERVEILESYLCDRICENELEEFFRLEKVVSSLKESPTTISVEKMGYISCLGKRQLGRVFQKVIGMSPKHYLRIVRFHHVLATKQRFPELNLTNIALKCGYYDQSHFVNDFKQITGYSPTNYFTMSEAYSDYFSL